MQTLPLPDQAPNATNKRPDLMENIDAARQALQGSEWHAHTPWKHGVKEEMSNSNGTSLTLVEHEDSQGDRLHIRAEISRGGKHFIARLVRRMGEDGTPTLTGSAELQTQKNGVERKKQYGKTHSAELLANFVARQLAESDEEEPTE